MIIVVDNAPVWHRRLEALNVAKLSSIQTGAYCDHFFFEDPAGYAIEIQRFHDPTVAALFST